MEQPPLRVVLDANVLYPFTLRDTLLRAAALGMFHAAWSEEILEEARRNLVASGRTTEAQATHLMTAIRVAFPDALVRDYEALIPQMQNDAKDRHVAAVALASGAHLITTFNLKDFQMLPQGVKAQSPDEFLLGLLGAAPQTMLDLLEQQARALRRPPVSLDQLLEGLAKTTPRFCEAVRTLLAQRAV